MRRLLPLLLLLLLTGSDGNWRYRKPDVVLCSGPSELEKFWIDTKQETYGGSDFVHNWISCSDERYYCLEGPFLVSFPKDASSIPSEWNVDSYRFNYTETEYGFNISTTNTGPDVLIIQKVVTHFSDLGALLRVDYIMADPRFIGIYGNEYQIVCRGQMTLKDLFPASYIPPRSAQVLERP